MSEKGIINIHDYKKICLIGQGSFGEVFKVREEKNGNIYAAKVSLITIEEQSMHMISREVNTLSKLKHPLVVKFVGFSYVDFHDEPKPVILTEYLPYGSLGNIIALERQSLLTFDWNDTRKLICIYGIATSMQYLHKHKILHRDLKPDNILMDEFLIPKICDFGLSKIEHTNSSMQTINSTIGYKGTPLYLSPEIWKKCKYSKASDVYAFGFLVYELITGQKPFESLTMSEIESKVKKGIRPKIPDWVAEHYSDLIEHCWDQDPEDRPSFSDICEHLREEPDFSKDLIDNQDFFDFVEYVESIEDAFESNQQIIPIDKFLKRESKLFDRASIKKSYSLIENKENKNSFFPLNEYMKLDSKCKKLVKESENNPNIQFKVGICLIEGKKNFQIRTDIGIKFLEAAIEKGNVEASIYYSKMLVKADLIPEDLNKAEQILNKCKLNENSEIPLLLGLIMKKRGEYKKAAEYFKISSKDGNGEGQYELAKLLYKGKGIEKNIEEALKLFSMSKKNGIKECDRFLKQIEEEEKSKSMEHSMESLDAKSLLNQGNKYLYGEGIPINKTEAARYYKMSADKGNSDAMFGYALMLLNGEGIPMNKTEAARYYKMSADKGNSDAMNNYADMLLNGEGIPMNKTEAARYYKMSIDKGNIDAMFGYGVMLLNGEGIPMNKKEAARYFKMSADKGNSDAMFIYGVMLLDGEGIPMNKKEAVRYFKMSADKGNSDAMNNYAVLLKKGEGIPMNKTEAARYYKMSADKGDSDAMFGYALMLDNGEGIPMNKTEAVRYYKMSIDKGNSDAMNNYANMLIKGVGIPKNKTEAARYFKMSADKGNIDAMFNYAFMLRKGVGIPMNKKEAARYFKMLADKGHNKAKLYYADMLRKGEGIPMNKAEAARYFKIFADKGFINIMILYADMLRKGDGIPINKTEAARYYKMSADKGNINAMNNYADMLLNGEGIPMNKKEAARYYKMSADKGNRAAIYKYDIMLRNGEGI